MINNTGRTLRPLPQGRIIDDCRHDLAMGAVLGALIGDAAGATLEFLGRTPSAEEVEKALGMCGGGIWNTARGQVTDDGELTLALLQALAGQPRYDVNRAARAYRRWYLSAPFDIGNATANALEDGDPDSPGLADLIARRALRFNADSKANGSLMRATPLGVWSARVSVEEAVAAARADARLTHPNPSCQWSTAAYVVAIRHLTLKADDHRGAFEAARSILPAGEGDEVRRWLDDAAAGRLPPFHPQAGFVRIAFTHAFHHLQQRTPHVQALRETLGGGGDTDTNACIVGGLLGALWGERGLPGEMRAAVMGLPT
ncbi:ADP-ribosylglycohydrolase family protein [Zoogloea sp.]|uniref:ADP-ribosylglycohydrolase family protein n=1 Tax=Zoogloea sp. TaxID=49181 RepID=UPI0035B46398